MYTHRCGIPDVLPVAEIWSTQTLNKNQPDLAVISVFPPCYVTSTMCKGFLSSPVTFCVSTVGTVLLIKTTFHCMTSATWHNWFIVDDKLLCYFVFFRGTKIKDNNKYLDSLVAMEKRYIIHFIFNKSVPQLFQGRVKSKVKDAIPPFQLKAALFCPNFSLCQFHCTGPHFKQTIKYTCTLTTVPMETGRLRI